jgi:hypothetical protein
MQELLSVTLTLRYRMIPYQGTQELGPQAGNPRASTAIGSLPRRSRAMFDAEPRHRWPRRRANAPGPGTEADSFDARPILPEHFGCLGRSTALL